MHPALRLLRAIHPGDLDIFLPHSVALALTRKAVGAVDDSEAWSGLDDRDPGFVEDFLAWVRWVGERWFRYEVEGVQNVPATGPALLVGNHNGGVMVWDSALTFAAILDHHGPGRAVYGLGHDGFGWSEKLGRYAARFGALRASHEAAEAAFDRGHLVVVYPGSELDSCRPYRERARIVLGGRKGFVRLALRSGVPVIPVVSAGAQEQFVVLTRGEGIARRLRLDRRIRSNVFPICWSLPWGITSAYLPFIPLPAQISISFLRPLVWDGGPGAADDARIVDRCYREVESVMQEELDRMYRGRLPLIGRLR
jgi:1-acyl-sn-glycerol-3-phosphate acyltransferase